MNMPEGEQNMLGPEQKPGAGQSVTEARLSPPPKPLSQEVSFLLDPEVDNQGNIIKEPIIRQENSSLRTRLIPFTKDSHDNLDKLKSGIEEINNWFISQADLRDQGKITKEEFGLRISEGLAAKQILAERRNFFEKKNKRVGSEGTIDEEEQVVEKETPSLAGRNEDLILEDLFLPLPEEEASQRSFVRKILDKIENSNREAHDYSIGIIFNKLESSIENMHPSVAEETVARLCLHDASELIKRGDGWISNPIGGTETIGRFATVAAERNHDLTRSVLKTLLEKGLPGLDIAYAWDLIQDVNFNYFSYLEEIDRNNPDDEKLIKKDDKSMLIPVDDDISAGLVPVNFYADSDGRRKAAVKKFLIEKITVKLNGDAQAARKSFQLAEKLTIATLETSVFNRTAMTGNDQLSEIIGLKGWRKNRAKKGRDRGPLAHEKLIEGFGTSWIRQFQKKDKRVGNKEPLLAENIDFDKIGEDSWTYFCTVLIAKYQSLKELILNRSPKPGEITQSFLQKAVDYFNKAESSTEEAKNLRPIWILGVVDLALTDASLGWDARSIGDLGRVVSKEKLSDKAGVFLSEKRWEYILKKLNYRKRIKGKIWERAFFPSSNKH